MNIELFFRAAFLTVLVAFAAHRGYSTRKFGQPAAATMKARPKDLWQALAGWLSAGAFLASLAYFIFPAAVQWAVAPFPAWLRGVGLGLALAGFALLQWAQITLGRNWSDAPRLLQYQTLTTTGPYRWIRHPIYSAFLLILSAPLFLTANGLIGLLWLTSTAIEIASRVAFEEGMLAETFGERYRHYAQHTGKLWPR